MSLTLSSYAISQNQNLVNNIGGATPQLVQVNGILYLITKRQIPFASADSEVVIYKSDSTLVNWSLSVAFATGPNEPGGGSATEFAVAVIGAKIYVVDYTSVEAGAGSPNFKLGVWTYDTVSSTVSGPGTGGPFAFDGDELGFSATNSGDLIITYRVANDSFGNTQIYRAVSYNPSTDTWGASTTIQSGSTSASRTVAQIHDPVTDKTVVFYNLGGTESLVATVLSGSLGILSTTGPIYTDNVFFRFIGTWGVPTVTSDSLSAGSSVALPFVSHNTSPQTLHVAFVDLSSYAIGTELVDDNSDLPAGLIIQQYDQQDQAGWSAFDLAGTLYVVFAVDNGDLDSALSQSYLYSKARSGGVWGTLQQQYIALFPEFPNEMMMPFSAVWASGGQPQIAITLNVWNPTLSIQTTPVGSGSMQSVLLLGSAVPPPSVSASPVPIGGGNKQYLGGCRPFNRYDYCLSLEQRLWERIKALPPCSVPKEFWSKVPWDEDFGSIPALAVPFHRIQTIVTPAPAAGDTVVSQLVVPLGYDGIITGVYWRYNGQGFIEGSGDIIWRIQVNQRYVKDLSQVLFTLGSPESPMPMTDGQLLQSRQRVSIIVNVPNLSGMIQVGSATITGGLFGFYWPKGVPGWTST